MADIEKIPKPESTTHEGVKALKEKLGDPQAWQLSLQGSLKKITLLREKNLFRPELVKKTLVDFQSLSEYFEKLCINQKEADLSHEIHLGKERMALATHIEQVQLLLDSIYQILTQWTLDHSGEITEKQWSDWHNTSYYFKHGVTIRGTSLLHQWSLDPRNPFNKNKK